MCEAAYDGETTIEFQQTVKAKAEAGLHLTILKRAYKTKETVPTTQKKKQQDPPESTTMPKCYAKELLTYIDLEALDFDQAKTIHSKLHVITPTLPSQVEYSTHTIVSLREAPMAIKTTYENYNYDMDAFPKKGNDATVLESFSITADFPLDALASLTHDQAMAMLTNYNNNNDQNSKYKTLHRKDLEALILVIHDIITALQEDNTDESSVSGEKGKKRRVAEKYINDTEMNDYEDTKWPDDIEDMFLLEHKNFQCLSNDHITKYIKAYTDYFNVP